MVNEITELMKLFLPLVSNSEFVVLFWIIFIFLSVLLFKQFKLNFEKAQENENEKIIFLLNQYADLLCKIQLYKRKEIEYNELLKCLHYILPNTSKTIRKYILAVDENKDNWEDNFIKEIKSEIYSLKDMQKTDITKKYSTEFFDGIAYILYKSRINYILLPIIYTCLTMISLLLGIVFFIGFNSVGTITKIIIIITIISAFLYFMQLILMIEVIFEGRFRKNSYNIILFTILTISPALSFYRMYNIGTISFVAYNFI